MRNGPLRSALIIALALGTALLGVGLVTGTVALSARTAAKPLSLPPKPKPYVIAIAPGHGGIDPGAISPYNGLKEKNVTLSVGLDLRRDLEARGVRVVMTRTTNVDRTIQQDEAVARDSRANLFISLWVNDWVSNPAVEGTTVFVPHSNDLPFAEKVAAALATAIKPYGMAERSTQPLPQLWVHSPMPTLTIETGFMSNLKDSELLAEPAFRAVLATGIANGVAAYAPQLPELQQQQLAYRKALDRQLAARRAALRAESSQRAFDGWTPVLLLLDLSLGAALYLTAFRRRLGLLSGLGGGSAGSGHEEPVRPRRPSRAPSRRPALGSLPSPALAAGELASWIRGLAARLAGDPGRRRRRRQPRRPSGSRRQVAAMAGPGHRNTVMRPRRIAEMVEPDEPLRSRRIRHSVYDDLSL